ncbi:MAG: glycosyltransferase family 9 protein [Candidatus Omnitrophica bacterium]|nr:glycosyltransferase family 9 protein [Candidatus Omnitrophota bacterium]
MHNKRIGLLKFVDHWVGMPICIVLASFNRLFDPLYRTHSSVPAGSLPPRNILVIKFFGLGSILLSSALIANIRKAYKGSSIIFLTFSENVPLLQALSLADDVLTIETRNPLALIVSVWRTVLYCHKKKIDIVIDIEFYSKFSTIMSFLSGASWRIGFYLARFWRDSLVNVPIFFNSNRNILEIYGMIAGALHVKVSSMIPEKVMIGEGKKKELQAILNNKNMFDLGKTIGVNIHASDLALCRRWPLRRFAALSEQFLIRYSRWNIILTGTEEEIAHSREFFSLVSPQWHSRIMNLTGELNLSQFLALLSQLPLYISNDTGPFHMAKAVGTRTISLWGPGSIYLYGPYGPENDFHEVIYKRFPCSPCMYLYRTNAGFFCKQKAPCMEAIEVSDVMEIIGKYLKD